MKITSFTTLNAVDLRQLVIKWVEENTSREVASIRFEGGTMKVYFAPTDTDKDAAIEEAYRIRRVLRKENDSA